MTWFKVDDSLAFHSKVVRAGDAMALWVRAGAWCCQQLTDGLVPREMVPLLGGQHHADTLVKVGLWNEVEDGYTFHQWNDDGAGGKRQPARSEVEELREKRAAAGRVGGVRSGQSRRSTGAEAKGEASASDLLEASAEQVVDESLNPRPVPSRPDPSGSPLVGGAGGDASQQAAPPKRGTRLPADFTPPETSRRKLLARYPGRDRQWWIDQTERFCNHWWSKSGKDATKPRWDLAWENWIHGAVDREPGRPSSGGTADDRVASLQALKAAGGDD